MKIFDFCLLAFIFGFFFETGRLAAKTIWQ